MSARQFQTNFSDEDSDSQMKLTNSKTTDGEQRVCRRRKLIKFKNEKSHRVIEKRRRDRMNRSLNILLDLIPHKKPDNQRRIEKTEIIETAVKYLRTLKSSSQKSLDPIDLNHKTNLKIDAYSSGYHNGAFDTFTYVNKHSTDSTFFPNLIQYIAEKELALKDLSVVPSKKENISLCEISNTRRSEEHEDLRQFSIDHDTLPSVKVPIFVLHPSGTHYIPMCIDLSIVSHAFPTKSSSSIPEQLQCHPVSIPVNFNPITDLNEVEIQNINIIGTRHQTSVRPN